MFLSYNNKITRKLLIIFTCTSLALLLLPRSASALEGTTGDLDWTLSGAVLTISGNGDMPEYTDANMPPWYDSATAITRVVIREGVTGIGSLAFYGCTKLAHCSVATTVQTIGDRAFKNCGSLEYLVLPDSLTYIGDAVFESCSKLRSISLPEGLIHIGDYAFDICSSLSVVTLPSTVTEMGMAIFTDCTGLTHVTILGGITKLPDWTFNGCSSLNTVVIPASVTEVGSGSFEKCGSLDAVYYTGESDVVKTALASDASTVLSVVRNEEFSGSELSSGSVTSDDSSGATTITDVSKTDSAEIIQKTTKKYSYAVNGSEAGLSDVLSAAEGADVETEVTSSISIEATINNSDGWNELAEKIESAEKGSEEKLDVDIYVGSSSVDAESLASLAGKNANVTINTENGSKVTIDTSDKKASDFEQKQYDFQFEVEKLTENDTSIASDTVYKVVFNDSIDFSSKIGVNVKTGNAYQYVTLYGKTMFKTTELQTTMVDGNGIAWFELSEVNDEVDYYVGVNVDGVDTANAIIPDSLYEEYGIDEDDGEYLYDAEGNRYVVGETTSSWGITGTQFAIYVGIGVGVLVLIVTLVMIAINKNSKSKAKYAAMKERDEARSRAIARHAVEKAEETGEKPETRYEELDIDEDELRLKVMKEMLEEAKKGKKV